MRGRAVYTVAYRMREYGGEVERISVIASSKAEAYDTACYEIIPELHAHSPYSVWVESVTYNNGNYKVFNTSEGNCY